MRTGKDASVKASRKPSAAKAPRPKRDARRAANEMRPAKGISSVSYI